MESYFYGHNERDYNQYKAQHKDALEQGRCLIVLYIKIIKAFPHRGGFFDL
jgi:uncharacterized protein YheU (UPF0270 family)